ncbi:MAG: preprotein translocase subunit SecE [Patescibacteria group bacterium]
MKQSKDELKKVVWPTKKEVIRNTLMVIGISLFVAVFLGLLDIALSYGLKQIL